MSGSKNVEVSNVCLMCNDGMKDTLHALIRCSYARNVWCQSMLGDRSGFTNSFES